MSCGFSFHAVYKWSKFSYCLKLFSEEDWKGTKLFSKDNFVFIEHLPQLLKHNMIHLLKMFIALKKSAAFTVGCLNLTSAVLERERGGRTDGGHWGLTTNNIQPTQPQTTNETSKHPANHNNQQQSATTNIIYPTKQPNIQSPTTKTNQVLLARCIQAKKKWCRKRFRSVLKACKTSDDIGRIIDHN